MNKIITFTISVLAITTARAEFSVTTYRQCESAYVMGVAYGSLYAHPNGLVEKCLTDDDIGVVMECYLDYIKDKRDLVEGLEKSCGDLRE